jgi:hypothetical protein
MRTVTAESKCGLAGGVWDAARIRQRFASKGLALQAWDKARTDWVTLRQYSDVGTG